MKRSFYIAGVALAVGVVLIGLFADGHRPSNIIQKQGLVATIQHSEEDRSNNAVEAHEDAAGTELRPDTDGPDATPIASRWPPHIEAEIWAYFSRQTNLELVSIDSVECTDTECEVIFNGLETNPDFVDEYASLLNKMLEEPWNATHGSLGTKEIAPGVRSFMLTISNEPVQLERLGQ